MNMVRTECADANANESAATSVLRQRMLPSIQENCAVNSAWDALQEFKPDADLLERNRVVSNGPAADAFHFDLLRTRVLQQMRENGWRKLAITSPTDACGKSTVALNLALSFRRLPELRTVLIDLDLRRPSLARMLGIKDGMDAAGWLRGEQDFAASARRVGPNLSLSANLGPAEDVAEILGGCYLPLALAAAEESHNPDLMIIDMPPMLLTHDMMAVAPHIDCVLLVAGAEKTTVKEIDICERDLASQTNVMGVILNKCQYMGEGYGCGTYG